MRNQINYFKFLRHKLEEDKTPKHYYSLERKYAFVSNCNLLWITLLCLISVWFTERKKPPLALQTRNLKHGINRASQIHQHATSMRPMFLKKNLKPTNQGASGMNLPWNTFKGGWSLCCCKIGANNSLQHRGNTFYPNMPWEASRAAFGHPSSSPARGISLKKKDQNAALNSNSKMLFQEQHVPEADR